MNKGNKNGLGNGVLGAGGWCLAMGALLAMLTPGCRREGTVEDGAGVARSETSPAAARESAAGPVLRPITNMVAIPPGEFRRFNQTVAITQGFWLGKYEVTQREYAALMGKNPSHFTNQWDGPVEKVSFADATAYCAALTARERRDGRLPAGYEYRLPSEAEWEYACRAGTTNLFSFGDEAGAAEAHAWTWENSEGTTHPVGLKHPNPWGLHDMHGNVWEWCLDWFAPYPERGMTNPAGPAQGKIKVFRGGGWNNEAKFAGSANRFMMAPERGIYFVGFRVALSPALRFQAAPVDPPLPR